MVAEYDAVKGYISIYPQVIHEGDAADPETWEVHWGTYAGSGANCYWRAYPQYANYAIEGSINLDGSFGLVGVGNRWGLDPYHEVDGTLVVPPYGCEISYYRKLHIGEELIRLVFNLCQYEPCLDLRMRLVI